jgi:hypothetical protein
MKKLAFIFSISFLMLLPGKAQFFSWGLRAGLNISNASVDIQNKSVNPGNDTKFQVGPMAEAGVGPIAVQSGLIFNQKGYGFDMDSELINGFTGSNLGDLSGDVNVNYFEVPVNLVFRPKLFKVGFYMGGGPYWGFATGGDITLTYDSETIVDGKIKNHIGSEDDDWIEKQDMGANLIFGAIVGPVRAGINYGWSLNDVVPAKFSSIDPALQDLDDAVDLKAKNKVFSVTVAVMF